jgi:hypothetical protein
MSDTRRWRLVVLTGADRQETGDAISLTATEEEADTWALALLRYMQRMERERGGERGFAIEMRTEALVATRE